MNLRDMPLADRITLHAGIAAAALMIVSGFAQAIGFNGIPDSVLNLISLASFGIASVAFMSLAGRSVRREIKYHVAAIEHRELIMTLAHDPHLRDASGTEIRALLNAWLERNPLP